MAYTPAEWGAAIGAGIGAGGTSAYTGWLIVQKVRSLLGGSNDRRSRTEDEADGADGRSEHGSHPSCVNHTRRLDKLENENKRVEEALTILIQEKKRDQLEQHFRG